MARIYPELTEAEIDLIKSKAERKFYRACRDQLDDEWLVLHSIPYIVKISGTPRDGEADFIIFSQEKGFIVVEIKGGAINYNPATGHWSSTNDMGTNKIKDPFRQGTDEKYAILNLIKKHRDWPSLRIPHLACGHAAFFPNLDNLSPLVTPQGPLEIMGGRQALDRLENWILSVFKYWQGEAPNQQPLGKAGMKVVEDIFCKPREVRPLISAELRDEEEFRIKLTHKQSIYLRAMGKRKKASICGGAGTGKTLLALERAEQLARAGNKTLLLCYNLPLAEHLKAVVGKNDNLLPMTFYQLCEWRIEQAFQKKKGDLLEKAKLNYPNESQFHVHLPYALAYSTEELPERFNAIVIDEGQDFKNTFWLPIEMLLKDEKESYLYIFFDQNQAIYQSMPDFPITDEPFPLTTNCRNTIYIHDAAYRFYIGDPVDPPEIQGVPIVTLSCPSLDEQGKEVHSLISKLIGQEKVDPIDIVILVASEDKTRYYQYLERLSLLHAIKYSIEAHRIPNTVLVDTVKRFKGLEAAIVLLWGIDGYDPVQDRETLYVAFSRAKSRVYIVGTESGCNKVLKAHL